MGKESDLQDLEYLVTCRQALSSNSEDQINLENRLKESDARNKLVLPEVSPERHALEAKLQEKKDFYAAAMEDLKEFKIGGFHWLSEKMNDIKNRYPDQESRIEEIKSEYKEWHATQSDYSHQG